MESIKLIIHEHFTYRKQLLILAKSDLVKAYTGNALGWSWAVISPLMTIAIYWFGVAIGLKAGKNVAGDYPYILWLAAGMIAWEYMSSCLTGGTGFIRKYKFLVKKMKFPTSIIPTFCNLSHLYVQFILIPITIVVFACCGYYPDKYLLQLPLYMLMMFTFFSAWGLFAGMLTCICRDFGNFVKTLTRLIFWLSGIIFSVEKIHSHTIRTILKFNPITIIAEGYRNCFIYKKWFFETGTDIRNYCVCLIIMIILAAWAFNKLRKEIPDVL